MKLKDIRDDYYSFSKKLSDITRQLSFAGIAVIWTLRLGEGDSSGIIYEKSLLIPLATFVLVLALDFLHYFWATLATRMVNNHLWKLYHDNEKKVDFPSWINRITEGFFFSKVILYAIGQGILIYYLFRLIEGI